MSGTNGKRLLLSDEVAARLDVSIDTVRRLRDIGRLPALQYSPRGRLRFRPEDVEALVERSERRPVAA